MIRVSRAIAHPNVSALLISPYQADFECLYPIFQERNWKLQVAQTCRQACSALDRHEFAVIVCECKLPDGTWQTVHNYVEGTPAQLIVCSRLADERLWTEVLDSGGYDVVSTPFRREETLRMITAAWLQWQIDRRSNQWYEQATASN
jgi:DNA-binding response OmpR family regulator